jgi:hypothetical protein
MIHSSNRELLSIVLGDEAALLATRSLAELFGCARLGRPLPLARHRSFFPMPCLTD